MYEKMLHTFYALYIMQWEQCEKKITLNKYENFIQQ